MTPECNVDRCLVGAEANLRQCWIEGDTSNLDSGTLPDRGRGQIRKDL